MTEIRGGSQGRGCGRWLAPRDEEEWPGSHTRGQLEIGLSGFETRYGLKRSWPRAHSRTILNLFYAHSLVTYAKAYSWEINKREKVESKNESISI